MSSINERIKFRRIELGLTLLQIAEFLGVAEATVQRYESGEIKNIKHDTIQKLSEILNCSPSYLMGWGDSKKENSLTDWLSGEHKEEKLKLIELYDKVPPENRKELLKLIEAALNMHK